jgi:hypothetical protein
MAGRRKVGLNLKLSTGWAGIKRHGVLIATAIFSKVLDENFVRHAARRGTRRIRTKGLSCRANWN